MWGGKVKICDMGKMKRTGIWISFGTIPGVRRCVSFAEAVLTGRGSNRGLLFCSDSVIE